MLWMSITSLLNVTMMVPCAFESLTLVYVLNPIDRLTWKNVLIYILKSAIVFVVYMLLMMLFSALFNWLDADSGLLFIYLSAIVLYPLATGILGMGQWNFRVKFTVISSFAAANIMLTAGISFLGHYIAIQTGIAWFEAGTILLLKPVFYILNAFLVSRFSISRFDVLPGAGMTFFWILNVLFIVFIAFYNSMNSLEDYLAVSLINIAFYVFTILLYAVMYIMCLHFSHMLQASAETQKVQAQNAELKARETSAEEIRRIRHDIKNQYAYMDILLKEGRYEDLGHYFESMKGSLKSADQYIDVGNKEVNSMLNMERQKAGEAGFEIETDVVIPHVLGMNELDLSALLINLIDNAIEANIRFSITDSIKVSMHVSNDFLYVSVGNKVPDDADIKKILSMNTSKKDRQKHGIGHRIVDNVCRKHDGICERRIEGDMFWAEAVVQLGAETGTAEEKI